MYYLPSKFSSSTGNIVSGTNYSVYDIADFLGGERVYIDPVIEPFETLADHSLANKILGWNPTVDLSDWIVQYKQTMCDQDM